MKRSSAENRQKYCHKIAGPAEMAILKVFIPVLQINRLHTLPQQELPATCKKIISATSAIFRLAETQSNTHFGEPVLCVN